MLGGGIERRLAAVLAADVAGYSRLMGADELGTLDALKAHRREVVDPAIASHRGRIVKTTGDGLLVEFASVVDAVTCAMAVQVRMAERNGESGTQIAFRIGINVGDIIIDGDDIFGDGVNVAARVENECEPGGVCLSANAFEQVRGKTGFVFDDLGERLLKNIDRPVRLYAARTASSPAAIVARSPAESATPLSLPDKPSIAVLPFQNMSGDPEQDYFADGMVEDIITALSRFKSLFVIARNSSFTYKGKAVDIKQVGREFGVRYVLEGSVRKAAGRVRITGQLIETATNSHLWAEKFDGELEDVFELQDKVTASVVGSIAPKLEKAEIDRARRKPTTELSSYDCFLRGMALSYKGLHSDACELFKKAFTLDPDFAAAYAMAAISIMVPPSITGLSLEARSDAIRFAQLGSKLGLEDAFALARSAQVLAFVGHEYEQAESMIEQAVALNPNLAVAWFCRGWVSLNCGKPERALQSFERMVRLSPLDPLRNNVWYGMACAYHGLGRYQEGCSSAKTAIQRKLEVHTLGAFIMNAVPAGRDTEAREAAAQLLRLRPSFRISQLGDTFPTSDMDFADRVADAFRKVGLPE